MNPYQTKGDTKMKDKMLKDIAKIGGELEISLDNIAQDDKCEVSDYSMSELLDETKYVFSTFNEGGHINNDEMMGHDEDEPERRKEMRRQYRAMQRFIKKYEGAVA
jgi:hypothetical protein